jgi:hypothetical protein
MGYKFEVRIPMDPRLVDPDDIEDGKDHMVITVEEDDRDTFCAQAKNVIELIQERIIR